MLKIAFNLQSHGSASPNMGRMFQIRQQSPLAAQIFTGLENLSLSVPIFTFFNQISEGLLMWTGKFLLQKCRQVHVYSRFIIQENRILPSVHAHSHFKKTA